MALQWYTIHSNSYGPLELAYFTGKTKTIGLAAVSTDKGHCLYLWDMSHNDYSDPTLFSLSNSTKEHIETVVNLIYLIVSGQDMGPLAYLCGTSLFEDAEIVMAHPEFEGPDRTRLQEFLNCIRKYNAIEDSNEREYDSKSRGTFYA